MAAMLEFDDMERLTNSNPLLKAFEKKTIQEAIAKRKCGDWSHDRFADEMARVEARARVDRRPYRAPMPGSDSFLGFARKTNRNERDDLGRTEFLRWYRPVEHFFTGAISLLKRLPSENNVDKKLRYEVKRQADDYCAEMLKLTGSLWLPFVVDHNSRGKLNILERWRAFAEEGC